MELAQGAVEVEFLLGEQGKLGKVAAALGFGNEGAKLALAVLDGALLDLLDGASDFASFRRLDFSEQSLSKERALGLVVDDLHGVAGLSGG